MVGALCWRDGADDPFHGGPEAINRALPRRAQDDPELGEGRQRWLGEFGQRDRWISSLPAALLPQTGSEQDTTGAAYAQPVFQGETGIGDDRLQIMAAARTI